MNQGAAGGPRVADGDSRLVRAAVVAFGILCAWLWWTGRVDGHPWGDDWAGYALQARALVAGDPAVEVATNAEAMRAGDIQIGPDAYPWGYPLMLAGVGLVFGDSIEAYKAVGLVALVALLISTVGLARHFLSPAGAAFVGIATILQPSLFLESGFLGSDLPFAALSIAALWLSVQQWDQWRLRGSYRPWLTVSVAILATAAFSVRSNGVVVLMAYVGMVVLSVSRDRGRWALAIRELVLFGAVAGGGFLAYFLALPDGSLSHASYLSFDPSVWAERAVRHFHYMASWPTFDLLRGPLKIAPFLVFLALSLWGWRRVPWEGSWLVGYVAAHLGLITVFPFDGGIRYYHPMLAPAMLLFAIGLRDAWGRAAVAVSERPVSAVVRSRWIAPAMLGVVVLVGVGAVRAEQRRTADMGPDAPFGVASQSLMRFVADAIPAGARVGFFKPRAFRFLSGRMAFAIHDPASLGRVDWYVFNGAAKDVRTQVSESALLAPGSGFRIVREISPFRVYARVTGSGRETIVAP